MPNGQGNQVKQRVKENPDDVNKVPVKTEDFNGLVVRRRGKDIGAGVANINRQQNQTNNHVDGVQARHAEVDHEEHLQVHRVDDALEFDFVSTGSMFATSGRTIVNALPLLL